MSIKEKIEKLINEYEKTISTLEEELRKNVEKELVGKYFLNEDEAIYSIWGLEDSECTEDYEYQIFKIDSVKFYDGLEISLSVNLNGRILDFDCEFGMLKIADTEEELRRSL